MLLPFRFAIGFPIEVLMGKVPLNIYFEGIAILLTWVLILYTFSKLLMWKGLKSYTGVGI